MSKPTFVVDASTCLKWIFDDEILSDKALKLQRDYLQEKVGLLAPTLWFYEVTNGIRSAFLRSRITPAKSKLLLKLILKSKPETISLEDILPKCLENAIKFEVSAYDSAYLTLARVSKIPFLTGDQKLAKRSFPKVKLLYLADY